MKLLGLYREKEYSPAQHKSNDARLLELVAERLRERKLIVDLAQIEQLPAPPGDIALVFSMCQGKEALEILAGWEKNGLDLINSPRAAMNTYRNRLPRLMINAGVEFPETQLVPTNGGDFSVVLDGGMWLKRGDVHAAVSADVQWVDSRGRLDAGLADFAARGISLAAIQGHRAGDEIKFYGIGEDGFFHWFYSSEANGYTFNVRELSRLASRAAAAAGLEIFGGDIIVSSTGELTLIDLNDWPSFAPCLGPASDAIARFIERRVRDR